MTRRVMYTILESKLLLPILDGETDLGTIHIDDGWLLWCLGKDGPR